MWWSRCWCRRGCSRHAGREFEAPDAGSPIESAARGIIFLGVPKGAVVHRVNGQSAVVAPAIACSRLAAGSTEESGFALGESIQAIGNQPASVADLREDAAA